MSIDAFIIRVTSYEWLTGNSTVCSSCSGNNSPWKLRITFHLWGESTDDFLHEGPVIWKVFPCHDVTMVCNPATSAENMRGFMKPTRCNFLWRRCLLCGDGWWWCRLFIIPVCMKRVTYWLSNANILVTGVFQAVGLSFDHIVMCIWVVLLSLRVCGWSAYMTGDLFAQLR